MKFLLFRGLTFGAALNFYEFRVLLPAFAIRVQCPLNYERELLFGHISTQFLVIFYTVASIGKRPAPKLSLGFSQLPPKLTPQ